MLRHRRLPSWGWISIDQALSSATNIAVMIALARATSIGQFGAYAVLFAVHQFSLGLFRTVYGEHRLSGAGSSFGRKGVAQAALAGLAVGAVVFCVGVLNPVDVRLDVAILALSIPAVFVQDLLRYEAIGSGSPATAAFADALWLVVTLPGIVLLNLAGMAATTAAIVSWCAGGWIAAAALVATVPMRSEGQSETYRRGAELRRSLSTAGEFVLSRGVTDLSLVLLGFVGAGAAVSGLKGAQLLAAPAVLLATSWRTVALQLFGRQGVDRTSLTKTRRYLWLVCGLIALSVSVPLVLDGVAAAALGDSWSAAKIILPLWGLVLVARVSMLRGYAALRALSQTGIILRTRLLGVGLVAVGLVVSIMTDSAAGLAVGLMASSIFQAFVYLNVASRQESTEAPSDHSKAEKSSKEALWPK